MAKAGLKPSLKKMEVGKHEVDFLGFKLGKDTRSLTTSTRAKLEEMEKSSPPKTRKQLQSLLGTLNYVRELYPSILGKQRCCTRVLKQEMDWTDQMEEARLKLLRMALESGELERRDETLPLHVCVTEQDEEVT